MFARLVRRSARFVAPVAFSLVAITAAAFVAPKANQQRAPLPLPLWSSVVHCASMFDGKVRFRIFLVVV